MIEKPGINEDVIAACLAADYGLAVREVEFLPWGYDQDSAVYRFGTDDGKSYFVKLRSGVFDEMIVVIPNLLHEHGIGGIIAPLYSRAGNLWAELDHYRVILYPFIEGNNGFEVKLTEDQWRQFGAAMRSIHTTHLPADIAGRLRREKFSNRWRKALKALMRLSQQGGFQDEISAKAAGLLAAKAGEVEDLLRRADWLSERLKKRRLELVLCHSDAHAGNILIGKDGGLYIVDWDNPILAPKERDLMFTGNAQGFRGYSAQEEEKLFYEGYGNAPVNQDALAYYRYERVIVDLALFSQELLHQSGGGEDRQQSYLYMASNFEPGNTIELAYAADKSDAGKGI